MRKSIWVRGFLVLSLGVTSLSHAVEVSNSEGVALEKVVEQVLPAVVKLSSSDADKEPASPKPEDQPNKTFGSGVIIDNKGGILTNEHVVKGMKSVRITFQDGHTADTTQVFHDPDTDLAVVRLAEKDTVGLTVAEFTDSDQARVLEPVVAIGTPFDLAGSATYGHISALHRRLSINKYEDFMQTDAAINPGSSGGPLFDEDGKVLGIVTAIRSKTGTFSGIGFVIPANLAKIVCENLLRSGKVPRSYLGVRTATLTAAEKAKYRLNYGVKVIELPDADAPSKRAGIRVGDIILKFAGRPVADPRELVFLSAHRLANHPVAIAILRDGQPDSVSAELWQLTATTWPSPARQQVKALGVWGEPISEKAGSRYGYPAGKTPTRGFLITDIESKSLAETAGLRVGSVILQVERSSVGTAAEVQAQLTSTRLASGALLLVTDASTRVSYAIIRK